MDTRTIALVFWKTAICAALRGDAGFRKQPALMRRTECGWLIINELSYSIAMYCLLRQLNSGERDAYCLPLGVEQKVMKVL